MFTTLSMSIGFIVATFAGLAIFTIFMAFLFRRVVEPNEVHIVQSASGTVAYGICEPSTDGDEGSIGSSLNGNSYFEWPSFLPIIGVQVKVLPLAVFQLDLTNYEAYDIGKVPFVVDVVAFFRIHDPSIAAKRLNSVREMHDQLTAILQGAVRTILAKHEVEEIMLERSTFGKMFTLETRDQLRSWGVTNVKNIELMDIRDGRDSKTISNIMAKKESLIDMQSRTEVAANRKEAEVAEIAANQEVAVRDQKAQELVGLRTAEKEQQVGIANEKANQEIQAEAKTTRTREMAVIEVETVRAAEIQKEALVVAASQDKETTVIKAEGRQQETIVVAEGVLQEQRKQAEGIIAIGTSEAEAKRLAEMATVSPQLALAAEIGENEGYQTYLIQIRNVEKEEAVGIQQAEALKAADIKVIANTGHVTNGMTNVMELFTSKGGTHLGAAVEALAQTEGGQALLSAAGINRPNGPDGPGSVAA